jgi:hypothetical protein
MFLTTSMEVTKSEIERFIRGSEPAVLCVIAAVAKRVASVRNRHLAQHLRCEQRRVPRDDCQFSF